MRIAIRVDASLEIGSGHVMRCLTLAETLRDNGAEVMFICRPHVGNLNSLIEARGFELAQLAAPNLKEAGTERPQYADWLGVQQAQDAEETMEAISKTGGCVDWIVVDHYGIDESWERGLRIKAKRIMVVDDLADRQHDCDLLLDQNLVSNLSVRYRELVPPTCKTLLGPKYALLQPQYAELHAQSVPRTSPFLRVLIYFGAADQVNLTEMALLAFSCPELAHIVLDVVSAGSNPNLDNLKLLCDRRARTNLYVDLPSLALLMNRADIALGGAGATSWERICVGLPALVVCVAENQKPIAEEMEKRGIALWLGSADTITIDDIRKEVRRALEGDGFFHGLLSAFKEIDGVGVNRVASYMTAPVPKEIQIQTADASHENQLLDWANDPEARSNFFSREFISQEQHHVWFKNRLDSQDCLIFIAGHGGEASIGYIRFEKTDVAWEISYALDPLHRGLGLGRPLMEAGIAELLKQKGAVNLEATVQSNNRASIKIFEYLGFSKIKSTNSSVTFIKNYSSN